MAYEVNSSGRADPVLRKEEPEGRKVPDDDPNVMAPGGLISLEDITVPWAGIPPEDWREPWLTDAHPEWTDEER